MKRSALNRSTKPLKRQTALHPKKPVRGRGQSLETRGKSAIAAIERKCDALWGAIIRRPGVCVFAGTTPCCGSFEAMHLWGRGAHSIRYDLRNGRCACSAHHQFYDTHWKTFDLWRCATLGPSDYDALFKLANTLLPSASLEWYKLQLEILKAAQ